MHSDSEAFIDAGAPPAERWTNRFESLGPAFHTRLQPTPVPAPHWVHRNEVLARELGLAPDWLQGSQALEVFSGNRLLPGMAALASVYSGHQFGVWAGQLGDGRAIWLGELDGRHELQLKGSGRTPYSRGGDGRAVLRSSIREYLCSEAMHALGIPTSRALCLTASPLPVRRETIETAAVVTRVAQSFIRFGHFEHFSARDQLTELRQLADHVIEHHYPECARTSRFGGNPYAALLEAVSERTAAMVAQWQAVGFCHGVMNTDNMSVLGLTLDYGPFQFLDAYVPGHICNHSDTQGRYAFNRQPNIAYWNLFCLAQALLPLIDDQDTALQALESYKTVFPREWGQRMRTKLGLKEAQAGDEDLLSDLLALMARERVDYTLVWRRLTDAVTADDAEPIRAMFIDRTALDAWWGRYRPRLSDQLDDAARVMRQSNPAVVLRNYLAEEAIQLAQRQDYSGVAQLAQALQAPYDTPKDTRLADFPPHWAASIEISCSS